MAGHGWPAVSATDEDRDGFRLNTIMNYPEMALD